jgi:hypothetical protein
MRLQIFGERNAGTNFIESLILRNFANVEKTSELGWKHWFPKNISIQDDGLLVVIVHRNPLDWTTSMYSTPWHVANEVRNLAFSEFIRVEWLSSECANAAKGWEKGSLQGKLEKDPKTGELFQNIFKLRAAKINAFESTKKMYPNAISLRYESVLENKKEFLVRFGNRFNLSRRDSVDFVDDYKGNGGGYISKWYFGLRKILRKRRRKLLLEGSADYLFFRSQIDWALEESIGYSIKYPHQCQHGGIDV